MTRDIIIMSGGDTREKFKAGIREQLGMEWVEHRVRGVDGKNRVALADHFIKNSFITYGDWHPRMGEAGSWATLLNALYRVVELDRPVAIIEDDALLDDQFTELVDTYTEACPDNVDVLHLLTWFDRANPRALKLLESNWVNHVIIKNWHDWPFGGVVMYPSGAEKIIDRLHSHPITTSYDVWLFNACQEGWLNAIAPAPYRTSPIQPRYADTKSTIDRTRPVHPSILPRSASR